MKKIYNYFSDWRKAYKLSLYAQIIPLIMLIAPLYEGYFSEEHTMDKTEIKFFVVYYSIVGVAFLSCWFFGYKSVKKYRKENG